MVKPPALQGIRLISASLHGSIGPIRDNVGFRQQTGLYLILSVPPGARRSTPVEMIVPALQCSFPRRDKPSAWCSQREVFKVTSRMRILCSAVLLIRCLPSSGQTGSVFDLQGVVELVDRPPAATPVEAVSFCLHPLESGFDIWAQPDRDGRFTLEIVRPGRYSLTYPMPGRIQTFADGPIELAPEGFELSAGSAGPLRLVVSLKSADVSVKVRAIPNGHRDVTALLAAADTHLTLRESCYSNRLSGPQTTFRFVPPGKYRIFVIDAEIESRVAAYAPRFLDFLKNEATSLEVSETGQTEATATYLDGEAVKEAIRQACPRILQVWPGAPLEPLCHGK
jgi:hypothetical protein